MKPDFMFTSESVTEGHPDKLCDQISDAIVDQFLVEDPKSRIIAECAASKGVIFIAARFASEAKVDIPGVARRVISEAGYEEGGFSARESTILTSLRELPEQDWVTQDEHELDDDALDHLTVRNQVNVFGFACQQTEVLMPMPIWLAHRLARQLTEVRREGYLPYLSPDGTTQVGVQYRAGRPLRVHSITLISSQKNAEGPSLSGLRQDLLELVVDPLFQEESVKVDRDTKIFVNPGGPIIGGGPSVHSGMTGRKNAIDTYGEFSRQSGSALSGKDPWRIDRIGAYAARYAAKNVVAAGLAEECEVLLSYAIGQPRPISVQVKTAGTGILSEEAITARLWEHVDFRLGGIIRKFDLRNLPVRHQGRFYRQLAAYGQVGRTDLVLPWEQTDLIEALRA